MWIYNIQTACDKWLGIRLPSLKPSKRSIFCAKKKTPAFPTWLIHKNSRCGIIYFRLNILCILSEAPAASSRQTCWRINVCGYYCCFHDEMECPDPLEHQWDPPTTSAENFIQMKTPNPSPKQSLARKLWLMLSVKDCVWQSNPDHYFHSESSCVTWINKENSPSSAPLSHAHSLCLWTDYCLLLDCIMQDGEGLNPGRRWDCLN